MSPTAESEDVKVIRTLPSLSEYQARCLVGGNVNWSKLTDITRDASDLKRHLAKQFGQLGVANAYMTKPENRVAPEQFQWTPVAIDSLNLYRNPFEGADIIRLNYSAAYVDLVRDRMLFLARARGLWFAGRCTNSTPALLPDAFGLDPETEASQIALTCFFGVQGENGICAPFERFKQLCEQAGIVKISHLCPLPPGLANQPAVGVLARKARR